MSSQTELLSCCCCAVPGPELARPLLFVGLVLADDAVEAIEAVEAVDDVDDAGEKLDPAARRFASVAGAFCLSLLKRVSISKTVLRR